MVYVSTFWRSCGLLVYNDFPVYSALSYHSFDSHPPLVVDQNETSGSNGDGKYFLADWARQTHGAFTFQKRLPCRTMLLTREMTI